MRSYSRRGQSLILIVLLTIIIGINVGVAESFARLGWKPFLGPFRWRADGLEFYVRVDGVDSIHGCEGFPCSSRRRHVGLYDFAKALSSVDGWSVLKGAQSIRIAGLLLELLGDIFMELGKLASSLFM